MFVLNPSAPRSTYAASAPARPAPPRGQRLRAAISAIAPGVAFSLRAPWLAFTSGIDWLALTGRTDWLTRVPVTAPIHETGR